MSNRDKYNEVFKTVFKVDDDALGPDFQARAVERWDSITHLTLMTGMEDAFDVMFDPDDILSFLSYEDGKEILARYDISIEQEG